MKRISRDKARGYLFGKDVLPLLSVKPGEEFVVETEDSLNGCVRSEELLPTLTNLPFMKYSPPKANPIAGPVYIEGARPGDVLVVNIKKIVPDIQGVTCIFAEAGGLSNYLEWPELSKPYTRIIKYIPGKSETLEDGMVYFSKRFHWPLRPLIGCIGVAPSRGVATSFSQGSWGGNLDARDITVGSKVYINCYNDGALLWIGDIHGSQGDGEFTGSANETRAAVTLSCQIIKNKTIPFIRIKKEKSIIALYNDKPLERAVRISIINLIRWMVEEYGVSLRDAYMLTSVNPDFKINIYQLVDVSRSRYTVGTELPLKYLE